MRNVPRALAGALVGLLACGGKTTTGPGAGGSGSPSTGSTGTSQGVGSGNSGGHADFVVGVGVGGGPTVGAGGATGVGGDPGAGGAPGRDPVYYCDPPYPRPVPVVSPFVSDFESGPIVQAVMPGGTWIPETDGAGAITINVERCGTSGMGLHFTGKGHTVWGAAASVAFINVTQPVDVSAYRGLSFVMRSPVPNAVIVKVQNPYSQPACGKCDDTILGAECYSGYIKYVPLSGSAAPQVVFWSDLSQQAWGYKAPGTAMFDPTNLVSLTFAFDKSVDFDVCLDDVVLVP